MATSHDAAQEVTMRAPRDVVRMIGVLASMNGTSIGKFNNTELREWVTKKYKARIAKEGKSHDHGGDS